MEKKSALIDRDIQPISRIQDRTADVFETEVGGPQDEQVLIDVLKTKDVLFTTSRLTISDKVLEEAGMDLIAKLGTGIDNVDLDSAAAHGVPVIHTPGLNARSVAEHTVTLTLSVAHRLSEHETIVQNGKWRDDIKLGMLVSGKTVGIIGFGNVGQRTARMLSGFHVDTIAHDPYIRTIQGEITGTKITDLDTLLEQSDIICINAELTEETRGLIDDEAFNKMGDNTILVNTARGPIVDTEALIGALKSGTLAGAGLDVFETEPLPEQSLLHKIDNVITTPHAAAMTREYRRAGIDKLVKNTKSILSGEKIPDEFIAVAPKD
jgi:phosphoglycerate dehydrogenase-like enzyme